MTRVLMIAGDVSCFTLKKLKTQLEASGGEVLCSDFHPDSIRSAEGCDIVIVYIDFPSQNDIWEAVSDYCARHTARVGLIGEGSELSSAHSALSADIILDVWERPVNVSAIVGQLLSSGATDSPFGESSCSQPHGTASAVGSRKRLVLVDDSSMTLSMYKSFLSTVYDVTAADSAAAARAALTSGLPDLMLLDYEMPVCSGAEYFRELRANPSTAGMPVIFLTGANDPESMREILSLRPDGYIMKSLTPDAVLAKIAQFFSDM